MSGKRTTAVLVIILLLAIGLWWVARWAANGGWPASGATGAPLPLHIQYVDPADGQRVVQPDGFCARFDYQADHGLGDEPGEVIHYYFDGFEVTKQIRDLAMLEYGYPAPIGEPCYHPNQPLSPGWHTVKITYHDATGERFQYLWRFEALAPPP